MRSMSARIPVSSDAMVVKILVPISSSLVRSTCWCSRVPLVCRSVDSSIEHSVFLSFSREFSIRAFTPCSILSESLIRRSSLVGAVGTVVAVVLLLARGSHDVVGIASAGGASSDSTSSLEVARLSDASSDSMSSNLGGFWSTWCVFACLATLGAPSSFW